MARFIVIVLVIVVFGKNAIADWQYSSWGMEIDKLISESNGKAEKLAEAEPSGSNLTILARSEHKAGPFTFRVDFLFDETGSLERIVLLLSDTQGDVSLFRELKLRYGEPDANEFKPINGGVSHTASWDDRNGNNLIKYANIREDYVLEYRPLERAGQGL